MASHGVPRFSTAEPKSQEAQAKESKKIKEYRELEKVVRTKVREQEYTLDVLTTTSKLLKHNPEYYTIWNDRRLILQHMFKTHDPSEAHEPPSGLEDRRVLALVQDDLRFLFPLLVEFPKCYWIWNHRIWLLDQATALLPAATARKLWQEELALVGKMLSRDSRNFHGWGYRRKVVSSLESPALNVSSEDRSFDPKLGVVGSMANEEFEYTTKMIKTDLSNFSAWHNRTKLILRLLNERSASDSERRQWLNNELELIHSVLFAPNDQSLWFYHQNLMCTFDPVMASDSIAPRLSDSDRLQYIATEIEFIHELLDMAEDCKWIYQALIQCTLLESRIRGSMPEEDRQLVRKWLEDLKKLDPLRNGRWLDLEKSLSF